MLTARAIETIKPGASRKEIPDRHLPGLYLISQSSGAKSWAVRYRSQGRPRKHTIGSWPAIDLKTARELASRALRTVAEGRDPGREKIEARHEAPPDTFERVAKLIFSSCIAGDTIARTPSPRPRSGVNLHVLPRWSKRLAKDIARRDVLDLFADQICRRRPSDRRQPHAGGPQDFFPVGWSQETSSQFPPVPE